MTWGVRIAIAAMAVFLLSGAFWYHGVVEYRKGYLKAQAINLTAHIEQNEEARKDKVTNEQKFKAMPVSDIDIYGLERGWMRADTDS